MKIIYKGMASPSLYSEGIKFIRGQEYDVTKEVGEYLLKTFGNAFESVLEAEVVTPKAKPRTRAKTTKVVDK